MKIGYIGVGTIASCMIEGFCTANTSTQHTFFLSPRNAEKSASLAAKYANITVCGSNQQVVDEAEVVFISMLAHNCLDVLRGLNFRPDQQIINVVATIPPEDILQAVGVVGGFSHVIPLPSCKFQLGPIAAYPQSKFLTELLAPLGTIVFADAMDQIRAMQAVTALMASFYDMLHQLTIFTESEGLGRKEAVSFISTFFASLCRDVEGADFAALAADMTPGGLNVLAQGILNEKGAIKAWGDVMVPVMQRIKK